MNKNAIYFLLLCLIAYVSSSDQRYKKILTDFAELSEALGNQKEDTGVLMANVRNAIAKQRVNARAHWRLLNTHCASAHAKLQTSLKNLDTSTTDSRNELNKWRAAATQAKREVVEAATNIKKSRVQFRNLKKQHNQVLLDYKVVAEETDQKLHVVKMLRDIISDELLNHAPGSFVQLNKFQAKLNELKGMLNNNNDSLYAPIVSVLLDLATEQNFSNQAVLRQILTNINNLDAALTKFRAKEEAGLDVAVKALRGVMRTAREKILEYGRMRAQAVSRSLDARHYIKFYNHEILHFTAERKRKVDEQKLVTKLCTFQRNSHKRDKRRIARFRREVIPFLFNSIQRLSRK